MKGRLCCRALYSDTFQWTCIEANSDTDRQVEMCFIITWHKLWTHFNGFYFNDGSMHKGMLCLTWRLFYNLRPPIFRCVVVNQFQSALNGDKSYEMVWFRWIYWFADHDDTSCIHKVWCCWLYTHQLLCLNKL